MCLATLDEQTTILAKLKEWFAQGKMFTSVDIANAIKKEGNFIRNRNVASYLRDYCLTIATAEGYNYTYTPIDVTLQDGSVSIAFLYHPYWADTGEYTDTNQKAYSPQDVNKQTHGSIPQFGNTNTDDNTDLMKKSIDTYAYLNNLRKQRDASA